ncbi:hypothetical protein [Noviherbaspirillum humi]|uniref:hypothetical protein n=1 Tax=Noviherbaspirillum humi TaxID=1688639 RepID=UPI001595DBFE|nr:hypothetical protein [Noviherbaspirillum humi]
MRPTGRFFISIVESAEEGSRSGFSIDGETGIDMPRSDFAPLDFTPLICRTGKNRRCRIDAPDHRLAQAAISGDEKLLQVPDSSEPAPSSSPSLTNALPGLSSYGIRRFTPARSPYQFRVIEAVRLDQCS